MVVEDDGFQSIERVSATDDSRLSPLSKRFTVCHIIFVYKEMYK